MTKREQLPLMYWISKSVENFASSLGPSMCPPLIDFPPAMVVTPKYYNTICQNLIYNIKNKDIYNR
jgi:hypothetical protein